MITMNARWHTQAAEPICCEKRIPGRPDLDLRFTAFVAMTLSTKLVRTKSHHSTRYYVRFFMRKAMFTYQEDSAWLGINVYTYATWLLLLQQATFVLEYFVKKELKNARSHAYEATVISRGKDASFWGPYIEEWSIPPIERATRSLQRKSFLEKAGNPLVRFVISKGKLRVRPFSV